MPKKPVYQRTLAGILLVADVFGLILFFSVSYLLRFGTWPSAFTGSLVWPVTIALFSLYIVDAYRIDTQVAGMRAPVRTFMGVALAGLLSATVAYFGGYWSTEPFFGRGVFLAALLLFAVWSSVWRYFLFSWTRQRTGNIHWLVLGTGEAAHQLWHDFVKPGMEVELTFLVDDTGRHAEAKPESPSPLPVRGAVSDLDKWGSERCSGIIVALPPPLPDGLVQQLMQRRISGLPVYDLADFYERFWFKVPVFHLRDGWFAFSHGFELLHNPLGLRAKRVLDVLTSIALLILLSPLMALIAAAIRLDSPGPVVFRQKRVGERGKIFTIYKFRSMFENAENEGGAWTSRNDPRISRLGRFLRAVRLDELPQLINVVRGDMSFIGPRPEHHAIAEALKREIPYYELRSLVKPGISGWAQVMYTYGSTVEDARIKLEYDLYYIKNYSLLLDIAIFFKTIRVILLGRGR